MSPTEIKHGILAGLVMLLIAVVCVLYGVLTGNHRKKVEETYPTTQARVTKLVEHTRKVSDSDSVKREYVTTFKVDLEYTVDGITYTCRKKSMGHMEGLVTVYYHPDNPKKVYIEEEVKGHYVAGWYIFAGIVGGLALSVIIYVLTQIGKPGE